MLKYIKGFICNGYTFVMRKSDVHNAPDDAFVEATALLPMCEPNWRNAKTDPPSEGKRVIATDGVFVGEAYITTVGGVSSWQRSIGLMWEAWARNPVAAWMEMPDGKGVKCNEN